MKREESDQDYIWDLSLIYATDEDFENEKKVILSNSQSIIKIFEDAFNSKQNFQKFINEYLSLEEKIERLMVYVHHTLDQNVGNSTAQKQVAEVTSLITKISEQLSFITPTIIKKRDIIEEYIKNIDELKKYFDDFFRFSQYTLEEKIEKIFSSFGEVSSSPSSIYSTLTNLEFSYEDIKNEKENLPLTSSNYSTYMISENREIRKSAFQNLYKEYGKFNNTLSLLYINEIKNTIFISKTRGYTSTIEKALYGNNILLQVYDNLIKVINDNLGVKHEYISLKRQLLKYEEFHLYDNYVSIIEGIDKQFSYDESKETIVQVLELFGKEYLDVIYQFFNNKWIDVYPNEGKRSGAYSGGAYKTPPYILMNYEGKINDTFTLIHELGHSVHSYFTNENQPYQYSHYRIFIAEIASTVNELLLVDYLLKNSKTNEEKAYYLNHVLEQFDGTVFRQTMFAEFERDIHRAFENNENLVASDLNYKYFELVKKYFGKDTKFDEEIQYEWSRIPHFYYDFYVYQYATSFCIAIQISKNILTGDSGFINKYLNFLKLGDSVYPVDAIKSMGIDVEKREYIDVAMQEYKDKLEELKQIVL